MEQYFAPDGVWHRADGNIEGREGLRRAMRARPLGLFVRHVITNLRASILGPSDAVVPPYVTVYRHDLKTEPVSRSSSKHPSFSGATPTSSETPKVHG